MNLTAEQQKLLSQIFGQSVSSDTIDEFFKDELELIGEYKKSIGESEDEIMKFVRNHHSYIEEDLLEEITSLSEDIISLKKELRKTETKVRSGRNLVEFLGIKITK